MACRFIFKSKLILNRLTISYHKCILIATPFTKTSLHYACNLIFQTICPGRGDFFNKYIFSSLSIFKRETDQNVLFFLSFDKLETSLGPEYAEKIVMNIISRVRVGGDLCVGVTSPNLRINIKLKRMADYLFRVFSRGGTMFIYGVHPSTKIYNVNIDFSQAHPRLYFIPVV